jgi:hypothetical protein
MTATFTQERDPELDPVIALLIETVYILGDVLKGRRFTDRRSSGRSALRGRTTDPRSPS